VRRAIETTAGKGKSEGFSAPAFYFCPDS
jgi:hypothetical protein